MATLTGVAALCGVLVLLGSVGWTRGQSSPDEVQAWNDFWNSWKKSKYYPQLYPFGTIKYNLDKPIGIDEKIIGINPKINFKIPFYGKVYDSAVISVHGHIGFPYHTSFYGGTSWPNPHFPGMPDRPFVAPYYGEVTLTAGREGMIEPGSITWGVLDERHWASGAAERAVVRGLLTVMSEQVRAAVVGAEHFTASYGLVVTWERVTFAGPPCDSKCPRNTFQAVILTDEVETHTIFNYYNITWVGSAVVQQCDPQTGRRSAKHDACVPANVGFNAGDGRGFTHLPFSHEHSLEGIDSLSGSDVRGRFVYQVNDEIIVRGGCSDDENGKHEMFYTEADRWTLQIHPLYGGMLGGEVISISGPCFFPWHAVKCRFGTIVVDGYHDASNIMKAYCVAPMMTQTGPITLYVSNDQGMTYKYSTYYTVVQLENTSPAVRFTNNTNAWADYKADSLSLNWNPALLSTNQSALVNVKLFGYREEDRKGGVWAHLRTLRSNLSNDAGSLTFRPSEHSCVSHECGLWPAGVVQVSLTDDYKESNRRLLWSYVVPLGWFDHQQMAQLHGASWPEHRCAGWADTAAGSMDWLDTVPPCPCTLGQAYSEFGQWEHDPLCNMYNTTKLNCQFHQGAKHCVRLVQSGAEGCAGNLCCFDHAHNLMYSSDTPQGSWSQRRHRGGYCPYQSTPYMSHFLVDIVPHLYCCRWSEAQCYRFTDLRPTKDCLGYKTPGFAIAYGDPHFRTFDGQDYTFNGRGEFWLLQIRSGGASPLAFKMQARIEQLTSVDGKARQASVLTAVVMEQNTVHRPRIQIEVSHANTTRELLVHVDAQIYHFDNKETRVRYFGLRDSVQIINHSPLDRPHSNFTVVFRRGIAVQIASLKGYLHVVLQLPQAAKNKTSGLLGRWDDDVSNDLQPRDNPTLTSDNNLQEIHEKFGLSWLVKSDETLFWYSPGMPWDYFHKPDFKPHYMIPTIPPGASFTDHDVNVACGQDNFRCKYDFVVSGDRQMAQHTRHIQEWFAHVTEEIGKPVNTCGLLPVQHAVRRSSNGYLVGSVVDVSGCQCACELSGKTRYECVLQEDGSGRWTPNVDATCTPTDRLAASRSQLATAIAAPIVVILVLVAIAVAAIMLARTAADRKRRYNVRRQTTNDSKMEEASITDTTTENKTQPILTNEQTSESAAEPDVTKLTQALEAERQKLNGSVNSEATPQGQDTSQKDATSQRKETSQRDETSHRENSPQKPEVTKDTRSSPGGPTESRDVRITTDEFGSRDISTV